MERIDGDRVVRRVEVALMDRGCAHPFEVHTVGEGLETLGGGIVPGFYARGVYGEDRKAFTAVLPAASGRVILALDGGRSRG